MHGTTSYATVKPQVKPLRKFHQIYSLGAVGDEDEPTRV